MNLQTLQEVKFPQSQNWAEKGMFAWPDDDTKTSCKTVHQVLICLSA